MRGMIGASVLTVATIALGAQPGADWDDVRYAYWPESERAEWRQIEDALAAIPDPANLAEMHELLASVPHPTGTVGDALTVDRIAELMEGFGLEVERQPLWVYISRPLAAAVEIVEPERVALPIMEEPVEGDDGPANSDVSFGWNAYSGIGDVLGEVVYANYGTKQDFEKLEELGVGVTGKIVIARYGAIHRGLKVKNAEERGAIGVILYTDPADDGWGKGRPYPEGGYANETSIQRGSIKTLPYPGDPLTPRKEATENAQREDPFDVALPAIPVQPLGWGAASEILSRMRGDVVPNGWSGGLPFAYAVEGGPGLRIRLMVDQEREIVKTWNVIGTLEGTGSTEVEVFVGAHHDAWTYGAADPLSGTICMLEAARAFAELAAQGHPPYRTMRFCAWAGEEHGLIGSTEYVESRDHFLSQRGAAYINLDAAAEGPDFGASASPALRRLIAEAAHDVPQAGDPSRSVFEAWKARGADSMVPEEPQIGDVGGGSDHLPFWGRDGVSVAGLGAGGAKGTAYHTAYDTIAWYRKVVGSDYESALMVTRVAVLVAGRLANAPLLPLDPTRALVEARRVSAELSDLGRSGGFFAEPNGTFDDGRAIAPEMARLSGAAASGVDASTRAYEYILQRVGEGSVSMDFIDKLSQSLIATDRVWAQPAGMPGRDWYRNIFSLPDEDKGYGASVFPWLRTAIRDQDMASFIDGEIKYLGSTVQAAQTVMRAEQALKQEPAPGDEPTEPTEPTSPGG